MAFDDERWALEVKSDGIRAQVAYDGRRLCLRSRPGRDCTGEFPELRALAEELPARQLILDGELVCLDSAGRPDFAALRRRLGHDRRSAVRLAAGRSPAKLMVFDVLHLDGWAVLPYARRRELRAELELGGSSACGIPRHFVGQNESVLRLTAQMELEGVVAKRLDSPYWEGRRTPAWIKRKHRRRERMVVTGWRERRDSLPEFFSLAAARTVACDPQGRQASDSTQVDATRCSRRCESARSLAGPADARCA